MWDVDNIKTILETEFERFNSRVYDDLKMIHLEHNFRLVELRLVDCSYIAHRIVSFAPSPVPSYFHKCPEFENTFNIDLDFNGNVRVFVKSKLKASEKDHRAIMKFEMYAIKPFALVFIFSSAGKFLAATRCETVGRLATMPYPRLPRQDKASFLEFHSNDLIDQGFTRILLPGGEIFYRPYPGLPMHVLQKKLSLSSHSMPLVDAELRGAIIFEYLDRLCSILKKNVWPSNLSPERTCLHFSELFEINPMVFNFGAITFSMDFKCIPDGLNNIGVYLNILRNLKTPEGRRILRGMSEMERDRNMKVAIRQLSVEIAHMCFILSEFPRIQYLEALHINKEFDPANFDNSFVLTHTREKVQLRFFPDSPSFAGILRNFWTRPLNPPPPAPPETPKPLYRGFRNFLMDILRIPLPWPEEFNEEWIEDFTDCVENFLTRAP